jgi:single-strand DNA-binding protein
MANLNKVMLIGRLTRDVEVRTFSNGGKVAKFGFAVTGSRKKNAQTGKWEDEPCFLDVEVFNRGEMGRSADVAEQYLSKGKQVFIEGHLRMDSWTSQDGQKRNKIVVVSDNFQFLEPREGGGRGSAGYETSPPAEEAEPAPAFAPDPENKEDIPF